MAAESQAEIAASVAALQDLGPGYDQALAEGLVERIGAEIDKRIAAEIDNRVTAEVDSRVLTQLDRYAGCRHQRRRAKRMMRDERRAARAERADRAGRQTSRAGPRVHAGRPVGDRHRAREVPWRRRHHAHGPDLGHHRRRQCGLRHAQAPAAAVAAAAGHPGLHSWLFISTGSGWTRR